MTALPDCLVHSLGLVGDVENIFILCESGVIEMRIIIMKLDKRVKVKVPVYHSSLVPVPAPRRDTARKLSSVSA